MSRSPLLAGLAVAALLALAYPLLARAAGPVEVEASLVQPVIRVGDPVGLRLTITHHNQTSIDPPDLQDKLGPLELREVRQLPATRQLDGTQITTVEYLLTGFAPGRYRLPALEVRYADPQGNTGTVATEQDLVLEIASVLQGLDDLELRDIRGPVEIPQLPVSYARAGAAVALGAALAALAALLYRRRTGRRLLAPAGSGLDPEAAVREELRKIAAAGLVERGDLIAYYSLISTAIRRYLDSRLGVGALSSTTRELHARMERWGLDPWQARLVTGLLEECDAAKWAHYRPAGERAARALTLALEIVELVSARHAERQEAPGPVGPAPAPAGS